MSTQTEIAATAARKAVYDKVQAQVHTLDAQLATLKAKAESVKADAELKTIANLVTAKRALDRNVAELKDANEAAFQQAKATVDARIAELQQSVKTIESHITNRVDCAIDLSAFRTARALARAIVQFPVRPTEWKEIGGSLADMWPCIDMCCSSRSH